MRLVCVSRPAFGEGPSRAQTAGIDSCAVPGCDFGSQPEDDSWARSAGTSAAGADRADPARRCKWRQLSPEGAALNGGQKRGQGASQSPPSSPVAQPAASPSPANDDGDEPDDEVSEHDGTIVRIEGDLLYFDVGGERGLRVGQSVRVLRTIIAKHPVTGKRLVDHFPLGTLIVEGWAAMLSYGRAQRRMGPW